MNHLLLESRNHSRKFQSLWYSQKIYQTPGVLQLWLLQNLTLTFCRAPGVQNFPVELGKQFEHLGLQQCPLPDQQWEGPELHQPLKQNPLKQVVWQLFAIFWPLVFPIRCLSRTRRQHLWENVTTPRPKKRGSSMDGLSFQAQPVAGRPGQIQGTGEISTINVNRSLEQLSDGGKATGKRPRRESDFVTGRLLKAPQERE